IIHAAGGRAVRRLWSPACFGKVPRPCRRWRALHGLAGAAFRLRSTGGETRMLKGLFEVKPIKAAPHVDAGEPVEGSLRGEASLKRTLTARHLILLGVGAVIGAGIFVLTGQAAANHAGPAIMLSFVLAGLACTFAGLCYAEFAAML